MTDVIEDRGGPVNPADSAAPMSARQVIDALAMVRADLVALRQQRAHINDVIRVRVAEEQVLDRMARIGNELLKEVRHEDGDGAPPAPLDE